MMAARLNEDIEQLLIFAGAEDTTPARTLSDEIRGDPAPGADTIVRFATQLRLEFHRVLALLLKREWEQFMAYTLGNADASSADVDLRLLKRRFAPDGDALFAVLARHGLVPNGIAYDARSLGDVTQEMVLADLHLLPNAGAELHGFAERSRRSLELLHRGSRETQDSFQTLKHEWLALQDELGDRLLYLERRRLESENLMQRWLARFGDAYIAMKEQAARVESLQRRIELKLACPALTREGLEQRVAEIDAAQRRQLQQLRRRARLAPLQPASLGVTYMSYAALGDYRRECKQALREIWLLIHPDKLAQHPRYPQLTDNQKALLSELWHHAMAVRDEELGFESGYLGNEYRSLPVLHDIVATVKDVLANIGFDTDVSLIVTGDTLEQQIEWLKRSIRRLGDELDSVQAELMALIGDRELQQRTALLAANPSQQENAEREMREHASELAERAERMKTHLAQLFEPGDTRPCTSDAEQHQGHNP